MYYIGLDVGTTGCKAAVFDAEGNAFGKSYDEFEIITPGPAWFEQDINIVLADVKHVISDAVNQAKAKGVRAEDIRGLSTSVLGEEVMPVDKDWNPLRNAILGMDYRGVSQNERLCDKLTKEKIYDITGFPPHPMGSLPTLMWMRDNEPEMIDKTYKYVTFTEYLLKYFGTEEGYIDYPQAGRMMAFDIEKQEWSKELLKAAEVDEDYFCKAVPTGTVVGRMSSKAAEELGLTTNVILVAGGQDQTCAALGAGVINERIGMDSHGTVEGIGIFSNKKNTGKLMCDNNASCYEYTVPGKYFFMSASQVGGILLKWFKNNFCFPEIVEAQKTGRDVYDILTEKVPKGPSKTLVLTHFIGSGPPWNDLDSRGAIVGLTLDSDRFEIVKAIMDSLTYEFKINMKFYESIGYNLEELRVVGGASKSPYWMQLKANILAREICTVREKDAACLGAAMIAMVAAGEFKTVEEAVEACVKVDGRYEPNLDEVDDYERAYQKYTSLYPALKEFNKIKT